MVINPWCDNCNRSPAGIRAQTRARMGLDNPLTPLLAEPLHVTGANVHQCNSDHENHMNTKQRLKEGRVSKRCQLRNNCMTTARPGLARARYDQCIALIVLVHTVWCGRIEAQYAIIKDSSKWFKKKQKRGN